MHALSPILSLPHDSGLHPTRLVESFPLRGFLCCPSALQDSSMVSEKTLKLNPNNIIKELEKKVAEDKVNKSVDAPAAQHGWSAILCWFFGWIMVDS